METKTTEQDGEHHAAAVALPPEVKRGLLEALTAAMRGALEWARRVLG
jgi:hypothetical protein